MQLDLIANTIRRLAMDAVEQAKSGHPGMPMGTADFASVLFTKYMKHNPANPDWANRDRFVLSGGHGCMLLYSILHLTGYDLPLDEIKNFRQWGSKTPGHPEYGHTVGVETTTGPLGQGCGNAVGMALAERMLAQRFNREGCEIVDHYTYVIAGDGDMMEGISHEALALAGHLGLHKLVLFYDYNNITIEGKTDLAYCDDVRKRFEAYNWHVLDIDAHDYEQIDQALTDARTQQQKPTLIIGRTTIAKGSPNMAGSHHTHGAPLGPEEAKATRAALGCDEEATFVVSDEVYQAFAELRKQQAEAERTWNSMFETFRTEQPDLGALWDRHMTDDIPADLAEKLPRFELDKPLATRKASGAVLQELGKHLPQLIGGSADLAPSNNTMLKEFASIAPGKFEGRNLHYGVREHGMGSIMNGMCLHGGFRPYGGTFLVFSDYCRPSIRLAALMKQPVIYVFTHDSIFVGEDGPTHQPVEHAAALRCIPNVTVLRPADATETAEAWLQALRHRQGPTALLLTRQSLPVIDRVKYAPASLVTKGGYVLWDSAEQMELILMASGSEVSLIMEAAETLAQETGVRVVSIPSWELFKAQSAEYRAEVLPAACGKRLAVEAGISMGWHQFVGDQGRIMSIDRFGASAPYKVLAKEFGYTVANVLSIAREMLRR